MKIRKTILAALLVFALALPALAKAKTKGFGAFQDGTLEYEDYVLRVYKIGSTQYREIKLKDRSNKIVGAMWYGDELLVTLENRQGETTRRAYKNFSKYSK